MNEEKILNRYWVDNDSGNLIRKWTDEEYNSFEPYTYIFEKYWSYYCPICNFIPIPVLNKEEAEKEQIRHIDHFYSDINRKKHKGFVEYRDHKLICFEEKEEFLEDLGVWICKSTYYK